MAYVTSWLHYWAKKKHIHCVPQFRRVFNKDKLTRDTPNNNANVLSKFTGHI